MGADPSGPAVGSVHEVRTDRLPIAVLALVLAACGDGGPAAAPEVSAAPTTVAAVTSTGPAAPAPTPAAAPPVSVPDALKFTAQGLDGAQVVGADYAGRDVALWFWAPW